MNIKNLSLSYLAIAVTIVGATAYYSWNYLSFLSPESNLLSVSFLDIGQGDSIYIRAPNGNDVLIDGGPNDSVIQKIHEVMPSFDHDIDLMVATHPDKDHIAGLISIFKEFQVKDYLHSEISSGTSFDLALQKSASEEPGLHQITARRGERFILDSVHGVYMDILFPDQDTTDFKNTNDASIVAHLVYGNESFLLTGDSPSNVEDFLISRDGSLLKSTVLKLGHHGSKYSSSNEYLEAVKPDYAIVSAGKNNPYHHPNPETVSRVTAHHIPILSTIDLGTITMQTDGKSTWKK